MCKGFHSGLINCGIYCLSDWPRAKLAELIAQELCGVCGRWDSVAIGQTEIEVRRNPDPVPHDDSADEFLGYPLCIEAYAMSEAETPRFKQLVAQLLICLWSHGFKAVAACGFEDELPSMGDHLPRKN